MNDRDGLAPRDDILAVAVRGGFTESWHRGRLVALAADGSVLFAYGDVTEPVLPRSTAKPLQAAGMLTAGLDLAGEQLALAAASHSGEPCHVEGVSRILAGAGLTEDALRNVTDLPLDAAARRDVLRSGGDASRVLMNCSGKHAAMVATCVANGWDVATYLEPSHPLQRAIRGTVERLAGEPVAATTVDGCGAPLFGISLLGLARAFRGCVLAAAGTPERRVADAMRAHPDYVAGTGRLDTLLMRGLPGALCKTGADGVQACALPDGRVVAFKISDGAQRALSPVLAGALRRLGVDAPVPTEPLLGGGVPVGEVQAVF